MIGSNNHCPIILTDITGMNTSGSLYHHLAIMQYALSCEDEFYICCDGSICLCHDVQIFDDMAGKPYINLCQEDDSKYRSITERLLPGIKQAVHGIFTTGYLLIKTDIMLNLISYIEQNTSIGGIDLAQKISCCCTSDADKRLFNAYELYGVYATAVFPGIYNVREWHCLRQGRVFFKQNDMTGDDLLWLSQDFDSVSFDDNHEFVKEYHDLFHSGYYREKLTPSQMLEAIYTETEGNINDTYDNGFNPENRLKYLNEDAYRLYERLGDDLKKSNIDQAYLSYENAIFLCNDATSIDRIRSKKRELSDTGKVRVNKTAFIVISYNNISFTQHCLESIYSNCNPDSYLLMIFDNGSSDGSQEWLSKWGEVHEEAVVILNDKNLGFSGGNNACCSYLPEGYDIFYLNNDTRIPPNALFWMRMALYSADDVGGVGAIQNYSKGDQLEDVYFDLPEQYVEYGASHNVYEQNPYEEQSKLCGFALLITREMYEKTGGFDEQFNPGFLEDEDLSLQIRSLGKRLISCQNAFIYHAGSQSFRKRNDVSILFEINRAKIIKKWGFDPTLYAAISENEYAFIQSLKDMGYERNSRFSLVHIGCGCGNMLGHIHYLYPDAILAGVEENHFARQYSISCISVYSSIDELPMQVSEYDLVVKGLG